MSTTQFVELVTLAVHPGDVVRFQQHGATFRGRVRDIHRDLTMTVIVEPDFALVTIPGSSVLEVVGNRTCRNCTAPIRMGTGLGDLGVWKDAEGSFTCRTNVQGRIHTV